MLREIEVSNMLTQDVKYDERRNVESLHLPASKTDVKALGCWRTWGCICDASPVCPVCAVKDQFKLLRKTFGSERVDTGGLPFFPNQHGQHTSKQALIDALRAVLTHEGLELRVTGHTFRVTGAQYLTAIGVEVSVVMLLARWKSEAVLRYVREAPLTSLTKTVVNKLNARARHDDLHNEELEGQLRQYIDGKLKSFRDDVTQMLKQQLDSSKVEQPAALERRLVENVASGVVHTCHIIDVDLPPSAWHT
eukprot:3579498-Amphidinium_carterae.1